MMYCILKILEVRRQFAHVDIVGGRGWSLDRWHSHTQMRNVILLFHDRWRSWRRSSRRQSWRNFGWVCWWRVPRLNIVECVQWSRVAKRIEGEMAFHGCVTWEDEGREVDKEARLLRAKEATALLGEMGTQTVEGNFQTWNMEDVAD
jgi:hypothetical protein